jgi:hypothetical protein
MSRNNPYNPVRATIWLPGDLDLSMVDWSPLREHFNPTEAERARIEAAIMASVTCGD